MANLSAYNKYQRVDASVSLRELIKFSLINWWTMDELGTADRVDSHGHVTLNNLGGNDIEDSTLNGWTAAYFNNANNNVAAPSAIFTNSNTVPDYLLYEIAMNGASFTIFGWVGHDWLSGGSVYCALNQGNSTGFDDSAWVLWCNASNYPQFRVLDTNVVYDATFGTVMDTTDPHFIAAYFNRPAEEFGISVDGSDYVTNNISRAQCDLDYDRFQWGRLGFNSGSRYYFGGKMARWGRCGIPLPIEAVRWLMNGTRGRTYAEVTA